MVGFSVQLGFRVCPTFLLDAKEGSQLEGLLFEINVFLFFIYLLFRSLQFTLHFIVKFLYSSYPFLSFPIHYPF
jgi:hypothetical protein